MPIDTGEHKVLSDNNVLKARFEDHLTACLKEHEQVDREFAELWLEINKLRPMVWKMWAVATALPALISVASYLVFKNG